jgi:hypothetical protein
MNSKLACLLIVASICLGGYLNGSFAKAPPDASPVESTYEKVIFQGPVAFVYWQDPQGNAEGYTRADTGILNGSTEAKLEPWATVYPNWVAVKRRPKSPPRFIPREQIVHLQFEE